MFAHTPGDTLELFAGFRRFVHDGPRLASEGVINGYSTNLFEEGIIHDLERFVATVPVLHWTQETAHLVRSAADTYPLVVERMMVLRSEVEECADGHRTPSYWPVVAQGFCTFEDADWLGLRPDPHYKDRVYHALAWSTTVDNLNRVKVAAFLLFWNTALQMLHPIWWHIGGSYAGEEMSIDHETGEKVDDISQNDLSCVLRWICTASLFIQQHITVPMVTPTGRSFTKRWQREQQTPVPAIRVITLRRATIDPTGSSRDVHWMHRWIVRGHWRNQWFPKAERNAPVWIHPHVKGPDDLPFLPERPTVFRVSR